jgi:hypothetical protein
MQPVSLNNTTTRVAMLLDGAKFKTPDVTLPGIQVLRGCSCCVDNQVYVRTQIPAVANSQQRGVLMSVCSNLCCAATFCLKITDHLADGQAHCLLTQSSCWLYILYYHAIFHHQPSHACTKQEAIRQRVALCFDLITDGSHLC